MIGTDIFYAHQVFKDIRITGLVSCVTCLQDEAEKYAILMLLEETYGNMAAAAKIAKMTRKSFWNLVDKHAIDASLYKPDRTA